MYGFTRMATASASNPRLRDCDREAPGGVQEEDHRDLSDGMAKVDSPSRTWDREQHDREMEFGVLWVQSAQAVSAGQEDGRGS